MFFIYMVIYFVMAGVTVKMLFDIIGVNSNFDRTEVVGGVIVLSALWIVVIPGYIGYRLMEEYGPKLKKEKNL